VLKPRPVISESGLKALKIFKKGNRNKKLNKKTSGKMFLLLMNGKEIRTNGRYNAAAANLGTPLGGQVIKAKVTNINNTKMLFFRSAIK
jgi:hypothetical protein